MKTREERGQGQQSPPEFKRAEIIPFPGKPKPASESPAPAPTRLPHAISVSAAFIQMLAVIQSRKAVFMKWLGMKSYQTAFRERKRSGKFKKGSMLDHKAE